MKADGLRCDGKCGWAGWWRVIASSSFADVTSQVSCTGGRKGKERRTEEESKVGARVCVVRKQQRESPNHNSRDMRACPLAFSLRLHTWLYGRWGGRCVVLRPCTLYHLTASLGGARPGETPAGQAGKSVFFSP